MELLLAATQPRIVTNAVRVSLVVGLILNAINHGALVLQGEPLPWLNVVLNFVVPYCVSSYSGAKAELAHGTLAQSTRRT